MTLHLDISLPMLLFWCAVFFFAALGVVLVCLSLLAPAFMRWMDARYLGRVEKIAEYEAACASSPPSAEPTVEVQVIEVVQPSVLDRTHYHALTAPTFDMALLNWEPWSSGWVGETTGMQPVIEEAVESEPSAELVEVS